MESDLTAVVMRYAPTFLSVVKTRSFLASAGELGISQSAVSQKIAQLESALGVTLLDRSTRPLTVTSAARRLRESIDTSRSHLAGTIRSIRSANFILPDVRFGMIESITDCIGADLLQSLSGRTHKVVHLMGTADSLLRKLRRNEVDVIVTNGSLENETDLVRKTIFCEPLIYAMPGSFAARTEEWSLGELAVCGLPLLRSPERSGNGKSIASFLGGTGEKFPDQYEIDCNPLALELVARGAGWTISYPSSFVADQKNWPKVHFQTVRGAPKRVISVAARERAVSPDMLDLICGECRRLMKNFAIPRIITMIPALSGLVSVPEE